MSAAVEEQTSQVAVLVHKREIWPDGFSMDAAGPCGYNSGTGVLEADVQPIT
tara:strand:+ start:172 stop:327 length:156 start_codon:yes stop_codon:yes gene_type:complete